MRFVSLTKVVALVVLTASVALLATTAVALAGPETIEVLGHEIDRDRVAIPSDWGAPLTKPLDIQVAYNGEDIWFRARFPADKPGIHHDYLVYEGGKWVAHSKSAVGSVPDRLYEDRFAFHVDDGAVRGFANQGCWAACHGDLRDPFMYGAPSKDELGANSYFADVKKKTDTRHYITDSRRPSGEWWDVAWDDISAADADFVTAMKDAGVFLDQWHWRAARGNAIGVSDDMWVMDYRNGDGGGSAYSTNYDKDLEQPKYMFDSSGVGYAALRFEDVQNQRITMDQAYYLGSDTMTEFDPNYAWKEGDAIPRRYLRSPKDSRADITSRASWADGWWTVELRRKMDTGNPDDKAFKEYRTYNLAFALYTNGTGNRFHYVTFPVRLGVGQKEAIRAVRVEGEDPSWSAIPVAEFTAFYPGQTSWQFITSDKHPGAPGGRSDTVGCAACHTAEGLAQRAVGQELRSEREAPRKWTWAGGLLGVLGIGAAGIILRRR